MGRLTGKGGGSPLLYDYLRRYQEDPTSRVFAPLAEAYRKAGMVQEAIEIAREGLRVHPNFIGGKVALARALDAAGEIDEVIEVLEDVVREAPDNIAAQRLLADSFEHRHRPIEALQCLKMMLYFSPGDAALARRISELEARAYEEGELLLRKDPVRRKREHEVREAEAALKEAESFQESSLSRALSEDPIRRKESWVRRVEKLQTLLTRVERYRMSRLAASVSG